MAATGRPIDASNLRRYFRQRVSAPGRVVDPNEMRHSAASLTPAPGVPAAALWQSAPPYHVVHKDLVTGAVRRVDQAGCASATPSTSYTTASISDDGDVIAFDSDSGALVTGDANGSADVFVWRAALPCALQRVSVDLRSREGDGDSYWPAVSGDAGTVAFVSEPTNLVRDNTNARARKPG